MGPAASQHADQREFQPPRRRHRMLGERPRFADENTSSASAIQSSQIAADLDCSAVKRLLGWQSESDLGVLFRKVIDSHLK